MTIQPETVDVKRKAGWPPEDQSDLESWIAGHRQRVEVKGEQVVLHPVMEEFQELIDADPIVRMYMNQMIDQVPTNNQYRECHLEDARSCCG